MRERLMVQQSAVVRIQVMVPVSQANWENCGAATTLPYSTNNYGLYFK